MLPVNQHLCGSEERNATKEDGGNPLCICVAASVGEEIYLGPKQHQAVNSPHSILNYVLKTLNSSQLLKDWPKVIFGLTIPTTLA